MGFPVSILFRIWFTLQLINIPRGTKWMICHAPNSFGSCSNMLQHLMFLMRIGVSIALMRLAMCWTCWNIGRTDKPEINSVKPESRWRGLQCRHYKLNSQGQALAKIASVRADQKFQDIHPPRQWQVRSSTWRGFSYFENITNMDKKSINSTEHPTHSFHLSFSDLNETISNPAEDNQQKLHPTILFLNHTHAQSMTSPKPNGRAPVRNAKPKRSKKASTRIGIFVGTPESGWIPYSASIPMNRWSLIQETNWVASPSTTVVTTRIITRHFHILGGHK